MAYSETKKKILIIDDEEQLCQLVREFLNDEFECLAAHSGGEGIDLVAKEQPVLVLVDVNLPDIDGFTVAQKLKELREKCYFAIFMISGDDTVDTTIKAFDAGADDFISKPFQLKELALRIRRSIEYVEGRSDLEAENRNTLSMANVAMAQASQYSAVMNFFKALNKCRDPQSIARVFHDAMSFFGLKASITMHLNDQLYFDHDLNDVSPIEKNIFEVLQTAGRIYQFGKRMMINGNNVSFLIKNVPDDETQAGEARDFLAVMVEGLESKLKDLEVQQGVLGAVQELNGTINDIKEGIQQHNQVLSTVLNGMLTNISSSYDALNMTEEQESFFSSLVENSGAQLSGAENLLLNLLSSLEEIKQGMEQIQYVPVEEPEESDGDDIELF